MLQFQEAQPRESFSRLVRHADIHVRPILRNARSCRAVHKVYSILKVAADSKPRNRFPISSRPLALFVPVLANFSSNWNLKSVFIRYENNHRTVILRSSGF